MFFNDLEQVPEIATRTNCCIIAGNFDLNKIKIPDSTVISPLENRSSISIKQVRDLLRIVQRKRRKDHFFIIYPAHALTAEASNALLKTIEQPPRNCHFVLVTKNPSLLLPTVLSRSQLYYLRKPIDIFEPPKASPQVKKLAKELLSASPRELPNLAKEITKHKPHTREYAIQIVEVAIEMLYKTFCQTHQMKWLNKIPKFITLHNSLSQNGHVKLHLVADLC